MITTCVGTGDTQAHSGRTPLRHLAANTTNAVTAAATEAQRYATAVDEDARTAEARERRTHARGVRAANKVRTRVSVYNETSVPCESNATRSFEQKPSPNLDNSGGCVMRHAYLPLSFIKTLVLRTR